MPNMESVKTLMSPEEERRWRQNEAHGELLARRLHRLVERGHRTGTTPAQVTDGGKRELDNPLKSLEAVSRHHVCLPRM